MLSMQQVESAEQLLASGSSVGQVAKFLCVSPGPVALIAAGRHARQLQTVGGCEDAVGLGPRPGDPTPSEIRAHCQQFRRRQPRERIGGTGHWRPQIVSERLLAAR